MFYLICPYLTISFFKFKSQDSIIITKDDFLKYIVLYFFQKGKGGGGGWQWPPFAPTWVHPCIYAYEIQRVSIKLLLFFLKIIIICC